MRAQGIGAHQMDPHVQKTQTPKNAFIEYRVLTVGCFACHSRRHPRTQSYPGPSYSMRKECERVAGESEVYSSTLARIYVLFASTPHYDDSQNIQKFGESTSYSLNYVTILIKFGHIGDFENDLSLTCALLLFLRSLQLYVSQPDDLSREPCAYLRCGVHMRRRA